MARIITYVCDECGAQRQPSNGWFIVDLTPAGGRSAMHLYVLHDGYDLGHSNKTLCGRACVQKVVEQHLAAVAERHAKPGEWAAA